MDLNFQTGVLLLLIAGIVAMLTRRVRLPYSVGLVAAGIILATLPFAPKVSLTKVLIFDWTAPTAPI
jgi:Na+:H+ antiporter